MKIEKAVLIAFGNGLSKRKLALSQHKRTFDVCAFLVFLNCRVPLKCKNYQKGRRIYSLSIVNAEALTFSSLELNAFLRDNMRFCNFKFAEEIGYSAIEKTQMSFSKSDSRGKTG